MSKISVIIPTYNGAKYLSEAVDSILKQTYQNFEIIVVDDGSTDNTREIVNNFLRLQDISCKLQERIRYFYQENRGLPGARNAGVKQAKGRYIAFLDADDELVPNALEKCIDRAIKTNAEWCIVDIRRVENGISEILTSNIPKDKYLLSILKNAYDFIRQSFFFSKKMLIDINLFNISYKVLEDWDLHIRLIEAGKKFVYINEPLYVYKIREDSLIKNNEKKVLFYRLKILDEHHKRLINDGVKDVANIYAQHMWRLASEYIYKLRDFKGFMYCLKESLKYDFNFGRLIHPFYFRFKNLIKK